MTPKEIEAKEKAKELKEFFYSAIFSPGMCDRCLLCDEIPCQEKTKTSIELSINFCDRIIDVLSSIKGLARLAKLKFWKNVKSFVEEYKNED